MKRRDGVLLLSLGLSLAAAVALDSFARRVGRTVESDARSFLAADYRIQAWRNFDQSVEDALTEEIHSGRVAYRTDFVATAELPDGAALTVSVAGVEGPYPFYGNWRTEPADLRAEKLRDEPVFLADESLKARGWKIGDLVRIGTTKFRLVGFLLEEPQTVSAAFAMGPRVAIHRSWAAKSGLLGPGSRAFYQLLVKSPLKEKEFRERFRAKAPAPHWRLITPEHANRQAGEILRRLKGFLSFVLLSGLFLSGAGIFLIFRARYLAELPSYLTMRCLGMRSRVLILRAVREGLRLSLWAAVPGIALGYVLERFAVYYAEGAFGVKLAAGWQVYPALTALAVTAALVSLGTLLPLREILRVPVQAAFRESSNRTQGFNRWDAIAVSAAALGVAILVSGDFKLAALFLAWLLGAGASLVALSALLLAVARRWNPTRFSVRQALLSLSRNRAVTFLLVLTMGLAVNALTSVLFLGNSFRRQVDFAGRIGVPNLFLLGVNEGDRSELEKQNPKMDFVPVVQARITSIRGEAVHDVEAESEAGQEQFYRTREYVITRRGSAAPGERIEKGDDIFGPPIPGEVRASLEKRYAASIGLDVGDVFTLEIAGVPLQARVRSLRRVDWFNLRPNFFIVLHERDVADAPFGYVGLERVPEATIPDVQKKITRAFPSITALEGESIARRLFKLLDQISMAVFSLGAFALGSCSLVFGGILLTRREMKIRELALFKCLGAGSARLRDLLLAEFILCGIVIGTVAVACSLLTTAALSRWVLDIPFLMPPFAWVATLLLGLPALTAAGGWFLLRGAAHAPAGPLFRASEEG